MTEASQAVFDPRFQAVIAQAKARFVSDGYASTRMEPIAREAGVSTATLYAFFESKAVLFEAVIEEASEDFARRMRAVQRSGDTPREQLTSFMVAYAECMSEPFVRSIFRLVLTERPRFEAVATRFFERGRADFSAVLIRNLAEMVESGALKAQDPSWAAGQLMGMIEHPVFLVPLITGEAAAADRSAREIAEDALETFWARYGA